MSKAAKFWGKLNSGTLGVIIPTGNNPTPWIQTNLKDLSQKAPIAAVTGSVLQISIAKNNPRYMVASCNSASFIQVGVYSTDGGITWTKVPITSSFVIFSAISNDGRIMVITRSDASGGIYISLDYGSTWNTYSTPALPSKPIISNDNLYIYIGTYNTTSLVKYNAASFGSGSILTIPFGGAFTSGCYGTAIRNDGRIYVAQYNGDNKIGWIDNDVFTGSTTVAPAALPNAPGIAISDNGKHMIYIRTNTTAPYVSNDYGVTWTLKTLPTVSRTHSIFVSKSGRYMGTQSLTANLFYISSDFGNTFTTYTWTVGASNAFRFEEV